MLCISCRPRSPDHLLFTAREAAAHARLLELRLDGAGVGLSHLAELLPALPQQVILTLRSEQEGGLWAGSQQEMERALIVLGELQPAYIDIESHLSASFIAQFQALYPDVGVVVSYHDALGTPENLEEVLERLLRQPGDFYKLVTTAYDATDALRLLRLMLERGEGKLIALAMGEAGVASRILAPAFGAPWSYAVLAGEDPTAPGQLTAQQLESLYRYRSIGSETALYGLVRGPAISSIGYLYHNRRFRQEGIDALYCNLDVIPARLPEALRLCCQLGFSGLSVTQPHKEAVVNLIDMLEESACAIGAVNTIRCEEACLYGANTDAHAALDALSEETEVTGRRLLLLGGGGAARAVAYAACRRGAEVIVATRRRAQAAAIALELGVTCCLWKEACQLRADIVVNATSCEDPLPERAWGGFEVAMDLHTRPQETAFLQRASAAGCSVVFGEAMFTRQAEAQWRVWKLAPETHFSCL